MERRRPVEGQLIPQMGLREDAEIYGILFSFLFAYVIRMISRFSY